MDIDEGGCSGEGGHSLLACAAAMGRDDVVDFCLR
jgi:hypothetical protein